VAASVPAIDRSAKVIVLGYHRFVKKVRHPSTEITAHDFEKQMQTLKDEGITVIPLKQFLAWRLGEEDIPHESAIITIDDGYDSAYTVAWPILRKLGYPFTLFLYTDYIAGGPKAGGASLSWEQVAEMRDAGVGIQSHTVSHADLRRKRHKGKDYEKWLWNELNGSKEMLERRLGIRVTALALPYGRYDAHVQEVAVKAGYELVFTVYGEKLSFDTPVNALGRYMIEANRPETFASAIKFDRVSGGIVGNARTTLDPASINPQPNDGATITEREPLISADLTSFGPVEAGSVAMRLSGVGLLPVKFNPVTHLATCKPANPLVPDHYTVIVSAKVAGRAMETRWKFSIVSASPSAVAKGSP
jgi:peptidoglycan/xylan/chitin deacetylase (PgdA/CDA1 family)